MKSTLIKSEVPADITKVVSQKSSPVELSNYSAEALTDYFNQDGLLVPIETIREKSDSKDFEFFMN